MRLAKLTGLEIEKLEEELKEVRAHHQGAARRCSRRSEKRMALLKSELDGRSPTKYGDERRTRDHERRGRVHDRGPDRRRGDGRHHLALGLHQAHLGLDVQEAAARRARAQRRRRSRTRTSSSTSSSPVDARLPARLHRRRALLLAQGARDPAGGTRGQGQADRQPDQRRRPTRRSRRSCRCASSATTSSCSSPPRRAR